MDNNYLTFIAILVLFLANLKGSLGIVGGTNAEVGEIPWQVSFQYESDSGWIHFCGGTILNARLVATSAKCCEEKSQFKLRIVAGASNLKANEPSQQISLVEKTELHPKYNKRNLDYDVCKVTLTEDLKYVKNEVEGIQLCSDIPSPSKPCIISGWGSVDQSGNSNTDKLQRLFQHITKRYTCQRNYNSGLTESMICSGGRRYKGGCKGDYGGPLVCNQENPCLAGISSWGPVPCGQKDRPTVYANVALSQINSFLRA